MCSTGEGGFQIQVEPLVATSANSMQNILKSPLGLRVVVTSLASLLCKYHIVWSIAPAMTGGKEARNEKAGEFLGPGSAFESSPTHTGH